MRLITQFQQEEKAQAYSHLLHQHNIGSYLEAHSKGEKVEFLVWAIEEDDYPKAEELLAEFEKDPSLYIKKAKEAIPPPSPKPKIEAATVVVGMPRTPPKKGLTKLLFFVCIFLFFWTSVEEKQVATEKGLLYLEVGLTPMHRSMLFDYPEKYEHLADVLSPFKLNSLSDIASLPSKAQAKIHEAEKGLSWDGIYPYFEDFVMGKKPDLNVPMFEKIKMGEDWRFVTPILLHHDFLHILFNLIWLWIVGFQIEQRIGKLRMLLLILLIAVVSNTAQYLMSGPFFVGLSGVICGFVGFIWQRQKIASWEGYPLNYSTIAFLAYFVIAIVILQIIAFILKVTGMIEVTPQIANTAHITGAALGILLARTKLFARSLK